MIFQLSFTDVAVWLLSSRKRIPESWRYPVFIRWIHCLHMIVSDWKSSSTKKMWHTHTHINIILIYTCISANIYLYIRLLKDAVNHKVGCYKLKHTCQCLFSFVHVLEHMTSSKTTTFQGNKQIHLTSLNPVPWKRNTSARAWCKCGWWNWTTKKTATTCAAEVVKVVSGTSPKEDF